MTTIMKEIEEIDENNPGVIYLKSIIGDLEKDVKGDITGIYKYTQDYIKINIKFTELQDKKFSYTVWNVGREIVNGTKATEIANNIRYNMRRYIYGMIFKKKENDDNRSVSASIGCPPEDA